jgi:hypothetical protein
MEERTPETRTRQARRLVTIHENHCHWCGKWFETSQPARALFCPQPRWCRTEASRANRKAEAEKQARSSGQKSSGKSPKL